MVEGRDEEKLKHVEEGEEGEDEGEGEGEGKDVVKSLIKESAIRRILKS